MSRILIIDDDAVIRLTFKKLLGDGDYIIQRAKDVKEAIDYLTANMYDLVLLDLRLPPIGAEAGFQILQKKRKIALNSATPVVIISGQSDKDTIKKRTDLEDNVVGILEKPVGNDQLRDVIKNIVGG